MPLRQITPIDKIAEEIIEIQLFLDAAYSDDLNAVTALGIEISNLMSRTGKLLADGKYFQDIAHKNAYHNELKERPALQPSILKELAKASCEYENYIVNTLDRLNSTCVHKLDFIRTLISKAVKEMEASAYWAKKSNNQK
jgi:hypothetical protein